MIRKIPIKWKKKIQLLICSMLGIVMTVQIVFSLVWMIRNFDTVPTFGDTTEYIHLSDDMTLDEYRPCLYPLLIKGAKLINEPTFFRYIYAFQMCLSIGSLIYAVYALSRVRGMRKWTLKKGIVWFFVGLYLNSIPMITFMNFSVLTDSIANSLMVVFLTVCMLIIYGEQPSIWHEVLVLVCLVGQSLLRKDRMYSCLLLMIVLIIPALVRNPKSRKIIAVGAASLLVLCVGFVSTVNSITQVRGRNGRVETNLSFVLLDRVVWPNMTANYEAFPEEIRSTITLEEAQIFDSNNNYVMYMLAPTLESRVGKEVAEQYYRTMAGIVWNRQSEKVLYDIGEDFISFLFSPLTHYQARHGLHNSNNVGWNLHCLSSVTPELTGKYDEYSVVLLLIISGIGLVLFLIDCFTHSLTKPVFPHWVFLAATVTISLWFSLGDGAPPNDRYTLIGYIFYAIFPIYYIQDRMSMIL